MSRRSLFLDFQVRNGIICHSCLSKTTKQPVPLGFAPYSQQAAQKKPRRRQRTGLSIPRQSQIAPRDSNTQQFRDSPHIAKDGPSHPPDVAMRFFEQDGSRRKELSDEHAFSESMDSLGDIDLKDGLKDMKANLKSQEERDAFDAVVKQMTGLWKGAQTQEDIDKITADMDEYTRNIDAEIKEATSDLPRHVVEELEASINSLALDEDELEPSQMFGASIPQVSDRSWNINQRKKISKLNTAISRVHKELQRSSGLSKKSISAVYKAYHAARLTLARAWSSVPVQVWDTLWQAFSADEAINPHRLNHVSLLARDMSEAKVTLSPSQQLLTIEAVFMDGWEAKAIENWRRCKPTLGDLRSEAFQTYWELGVRMYCRMGDLDQAEQAASKLLDQQRDARILMPLIQAWCEKSAAGGQKQAWDTYRRMRTLLGKEMKLSDYDQVVSYFLATGQTENALFAFVDMMSDGQIDMTKQKYMPTVIANKFFVGKWLKRLIGAGDLDGAYRVVEFMRAKGVQTSSIQLNGLIGAWQRSGGSKDLEMADKVAWSMVEERIRFVNQRNNQDAALEQSTSTASVPRATLETFCLLAENYRQRELHQRQEQLWDAFHEARISPDAFMMNQLLESYIQVGQHKEALALYDSLVSKRGITPDPYTFSALWKTPAVNRLHVVSPDNRGEEIGITRQLFKETLKFRAVFMPDGMDGQLARKILHSFRRLQDNSGMLVALAALRQAFKFLPPEMLAIEMLIGTQKLSWDTASQRKRLLIAKREMENGLMEWAEGDLDKLQDDKREEALYSYLQKKFWPVDGTKDLVHAANEMGAADLLGGKM